MKKRSDSKMHLVEIIWSEQKEGLEAYAKPDEDITESTKKAIKRLISKIEESFLSDPMQYQRKKRCEDGIVLNSYEYPNDFILLSRYMANLKFKRIDIDGISIDTFLKKCKMLKENPSKKDVIAFHAMASFFGGFYKYSKANEPCDYIKNLWIASLNLNYLEEHIHSSKNQDDCMKEEKVWLSKNKCEIKKKLLLYCVSSRKGNILFAGKTISELTHPL